MSEIIDRINVRWWGYDGSFWPLRGEGDVNITQGGILGLRSLKTSTFTRTSAVLDGQVTTGWRALPRELDLPVDIAGENAIDWLRIDRAFRKTMRADRYGRLEVIAPDGEVRWINARMDDDGDSESLSYDPAAEGASASVFGLIADDPWFHSDVITHPFPFASQDAANFYGPTGYGPPFYLAPAVFTGAATISNPGDVPAWPLWRFTSGTAGFRITVSGRVIAGDVDVLPGQTLEVDTDPLVQSALLYDADGSFTNVTDHLTSIGFAPIPDGEEVDVSVLVYGPGTAEVELLPRYFRAW